MATTTLQAESARTTSDIDPAHFEATAAMMGLPSDHPDVVARVKREATEAAAMEYAADAVSAAMDALALLECLEMAQMFDRPHEMDMHQRKTVDQLLRIARRNLRAAVGGNAQPGFDAFSNMIAAYGLCIYKE
jgi:hypothetical protein